MVPLSEAHEGFSLRVECLPDHLVLRNRLLSMGIRPGAELQVLRRGKPGGILHVACGVLEFMIRHEHAQAVGVSPVAAAVPGA